MLKTMSGALLALAIAPMTAQAQNYTQFPSPVLNQNVQHSWLTGRTICIPPYERPFPVRVYSTPQMPPYYNVPPYWVVSPY